jgi:hypothetical protein
MKFLILFLFPFLMNWGTSPEATTKVTDSFETLDVISARICWKGPKGRRTCITISKGIKDGLEIEAEAFYSADGNTVLLKADGYKANSFTVGENVQIPTCGGSTLSLRKGSEIYSDGGYFVVRND